MPPQPINLFDYEALAAERLSSMALDYFRGGAGDEITLKENRAAFERLRLLPRVLVDVGQRDLRTTVLGTSMAFPVIIAPTAFHRLAHPDGEVATARAAGATGVIMTLSSLATTSIEEVAAATSGLFWFQLYVYRDREVTRELVQRAEAAGARVLVITVDAPLLGRRERDVRNGFALPPGLTVVNLSAAGLGAVSAPASESGLAAYFTSRLDASITWRDLDWLRGITRLPIALKGIHRPDDAERAIDHGAAAIIVSNHGARQLDTVPAGIDLLPPIIESVAGRVEVLVDGGVRRGTDVVKAIAFGAKAVLVGRPIIWGLAVDGESGVAHVLRLLRDEFDLALALCGCADVGAIDRSLIA